MLFLYSPKKYRQRRATTEGFLRFYGKRARFQVIQILIQILIRDDIVFVNKWIDNVQFTKSGDLLINEAFVARCHKAPFWGNCRQKWNLSRKGL